MQAELSKQTTYELYNKLKSISDASLATLSAWRDVEQYCAEHDYELVAPEYIDGWLEICTRCIYTLRWLSNLYPASDNSKPEYWTRWEHGMGRGVAEHLYRVMQIVDGSTPI